MRSLPLGIDLGTTAVRAARLVEDARGVHLSNYAEVALPADAVDAAGLIAEETAAVDAIADILSRLGYRRRLGGIQVISGITPPLAAVDAFDLRAIKDPRRARRSAELRAAEFGKAEPLEKIDDCAVSVHAERATPGAYIVVKSLRTGLKQRERVFSKAGCAPSIEFSGFALMRALPAAHAIVDIGAARTLLYAPKGSIPLVRSFKFGGRAITERVSRGHAVDSEQAQSRLEVEGVAADGAASWYAGAFASDLRSAMTALTNEQNLMMQDVTLVGNGARIPGLVERLERETLSSVRLADLSNVLADGIPSPVLADLGPTLTLAVGHALWGASMTLQPLVSAAAPEAVLS